MPEAAQSGRSLYVYYRVAQTMAETLQPRVEAMQSGLRESFAGLSVALMRRADLVDGGSEFTWMEVYTHPQGVSMACEKALTDAAAKLSPWGMGPRHIEVFVSMKATPVAGMD